MLICGDVIRPGLPWMLTRTHARLAGAMAHTRDPQGFAQLQRLAETQPASSAVDARVAATRIATILACKGGRVGDITVGDCVELVDTLRQVHARGGQKKVDFYLRLRTIGIFPDDAPHTIRAFGQATVRLTIEELVDRYPLRCRPIRDLLVDYLRERQPSLDFASIDAISRSLAGLFWARIEAIAPGIDTLQLPQDIIRTWKEDLATKKRTITNAAGEQIEVATPRLNAKDELLRVRSVLPRRRSMGRRRSRPMGPVGRSLPDRRRRDPTSQGTQTPQGADGPAHPRTTACAAGTGAHRQPAPPHRTTVLAGS